MLLRSQAFLEAEVEEARQERAVAQAQVTVLQETHDKITEGAVWGQAL